MKVRQIKYRLATRRGMFIHATKFVEAAAARREAPVFTDEKLNHLLSLAQVPAVVSEARQYTVSRKKDGGVIGVYETLAEAEEVIAKAKAQKKAALVLQ